MLNQRTLYAIQEALATRKVCMLQQALERWHSTAEAQKGHWMNFVRTNEVSALVHIKRSECMRICLKLT